LRWRLDAGSVWAVASAVDSIGEQIRTLSDSEKQDLLRLLLESIDGPLDSDADAAWFHEIQRRSAEIDSGTVKCIPAANVFAKGFR
jgi:hypothetical protein